MPDAIMEIFDFLHKPLDEIYQSTAMQTYSVYRTKACCNLQQAFTFIKFKIISDQFADKQIKGLFHAVLNIGDEIKRSFSGDVFDWQTGVPLWVISVILSFVRSSPYQ